MDFFGKEFQILLMDCFSIRYLKDVFEWAEIIIVNQSQCTFLDLI